MPISMTQHAPQMPAEAYEQIIADVEQPLRGFDGFISHAAEITTDGVTATGVWETRTAQRTRSVAVSVAARQRGWTPQRWRLVEVAAVALLPDGRRSSAALLAGRVVLVGGI